MSATLQPLVGSTRRRRSAARPLYLLMLAYPVAWALGAGYFIWPVLSLGFVISLLARRRLHLPRGFGIWLLFLIWMAFSSIECNTTTRYVLFAWRASIYITATVVFLWIVNLRRAQLPDSAVAGAVTVLWVEAIIGGVLGVLFPSFSFHAPLERITPHSLLNDPTVYAYIHPALADLKFRALGHPFGRPKALFAYTNQWGACVGVMTPLVIAFLSRVRRRGLRWTLIGLLLLSLAPIIVSINRGLWIALIIGVLYAGIRLAASGRSRALLAVVLVLVAAGGVVALSPLSTIIHQRTTSQVNSNDTRSTLAVQALQQVGQSPLLGYGSPRPSPTASPYLTAHTGTQGQLFLVLFSHGFPGLIFYLGWFGYLLVRTWRVTSTFGLWCHVAILISLIQIPFYDYMPTTFYVVMIASALAWRNRARRPPPVPRAATARSAPAERVLA
ncbi:MAG TPA: O-antigen ligase family protein [Solirubrobacteraceae bacterium]|nr:O-antigen ligase family protein [Solirubrobacteraceae bacterium]